MKIIYKVFIRYVEDKDQEYEHYFGDYSAIEDWLEAQTKEINLLFIISLVLCDKCQKYRPEMSIHLMKKYSSLMFLCNDCVDYYKIDTNNYIKQDKKGAK